MKRKLDTPNQPNKTRVTEQYREASKETTESELVQLVLCDFSEYVEGINCLRRVYDETRKETLEWVNERMDFLFCPWTTFIKGSQWFDYDCVFAKCVRSYRIRQSMRFFLPHSTTMIRSLMERIRELITVLTAMWSSTNVMRLVKNLATLFVQDEDIITHLSSLPLLECSTGYNHVRKSGAPKCFMSDREVCAELLAIDGRLLARMDPEFRRDRAMARIAIRQNGLSLEHCSSTLQDDRELVMEAIEENPLAFEYSSSRLSSDKVLLLRAIQKDGRALEYASESLQGNINMAMIACETAGLEALNSTWSELRQESSLILKAMRCEKELNMKKISISNPRRLELLRTHLDFDLIRDKEVVMEVISTYPEFYQRLPSDVARDPDVVLEYLACEPDGIHNIHFSLFNDLEFVRKALSLEGVLSSILGVCRVEECASQIVVTQYYSRRCETRAERNRRRISDTRCQTGIIGDGSDDLTEDEMDVPVDEREVSPRSSSSSGGLPLGGFTPSRSATGTDYGLESYIQDLGEYTDSARAPRSRPPPLNTPVRELLHPFGSPERGDEISQGNTSPQSLSDSVSPSSEGSSSGDISESSSSLSGLVGFGECGASPDVMYAAVLKTFSRYPGEVSALLPVIKKEWVIIDIIVHDEKLAYYISQHLRSREVWDFIAEWKPHLLIYTIGHGNIALKARPSIIPNLLRMKFNVDPLVFSCGTLNEEEEKKGMENLACYHVALRMFLIGMGDQIEPYTNTLIRDCGICFHSPCSKEQILRDDHLLEYGRLDPSDEFSGQLMHDHGIDTTFDISAMIGRISVRYPRIFRTMRGY